MEEWLYAMIFGKARTGEIPMGSCFNPLPLAKQGARGRGIEGAGTKFLLLAQRKNEGPELQNRVDACKRETAGGGGRRGEAM